MYHYDVENLCLENEIWKDVVGFEEIYEVSNFGRVRTKFRVMMYDRNLGRGEEKKTVHPRIRKPKLDKKRGYLVVGLNGRGKSKNHCIHSLVAKSFLFNFESGEGGDSLVVNHIDGNKLNNNIGNLEIITAKENVRHAFLNGLMQSHKVVYNGVEYYSKAEFRRVNKVSENKMKKMIESKEIQVFIKGGTDES